MFGFNPMGGMGRMFNPFRSDGAKADDSTAYAAMAGGPMSMANPTLQLAAQVAGRADAAKAQGSPAGDLLHDTQNLLSSMANQGDGLGWSPQSATQLLGRIGNAVASGGLSPEDAGVLGRAANVIGQNLQSQPGGELDMFGGANAPTQPFGCGGGQNPLMSFLAGFFSQGGSHGGCFGGGDQF